MENRTPVTPAPQHTLPRILGDFAQGDVARFHMPGHKGRGLGRFLPPEAARCDVTELSMTDNLHAPEGCIADTQLAVARAYGARASFLLVNGSTAALQAMLLSLEPDDRLLLYRDCHRSAISAAALAGVETVLETPGFDEAAGLFAMPDADALSAALARTGATAVLITSPNAYGYCADLPALSAAAHAHGALLLVDAAHGAHFPFCDALPPGAAGFADLWGHSQHKTLNALTQAATLHLGDCRIPPERVQRALSLLQTTSPSYLLMSSIDWAVFMAARDDWRAHIRRCEALRREIGAIAGLSAAPAPTAETAASGAIAITASHNGNEWNALKFIGPDGLFLNQTANDELLDIYNQPDSNYVTENRIRTEKCLPDAFRMHQEKILRSVNADAIRKKHFRVAVDCCNGVGALYSRKFLESLGCETVSIFDTWGNGFERPPEPVPAHLGALSECVRKHRCALGFAQDPDGDRISLVSGSGAIGIEALSRGAERAVFIEQKKEAASCIRENLRFTHLEDRGEVLVCDVLDGLNRLQGREPFHILFLDPPYGQGEERRVLEYLARRNPSFVDDDTLILVEAAKKTDFGYLPSLGLEAFRVKEYKTNMHVFIRRKE